LVEKDFNVGPITKDFPILKLWNLFDTENIKRYEKVTKKQTGKGANTFR